MRIVGQTAATIAASIERQLGSVAPGTTLPPVRAVAGRLRVSPATVAAAYKLLHARGLAVGGGRRGTRLLGSGPSAGVQLRMTVPDTLTDLASGAPDPDLLPRDLPGQGLMELHHDGGSPLDPSLMAFAATEFDADGIPASHLTMAAGALDAIERLLREHLRTGDGVALEDPVLPQIRDLVVTSGFPATPVALDGEGPQPDSIAAALEGGCRAVIVTPRAQNPTGASISEARAADLRRVLRKHPEVLVIENDYAAPIAGSAHGPLRTSDGAWAIVRSTSKFLGPDLRLALVAGEKTTIARVRHRQALGARWVSRLVQRLVLAAWSDPSGARRLARAAEIYTVRREALVAALADHGIAAPATSGFNLWVRVREESAVVAALMTRGWAVAAGEPFRMRAAPAIRVTTSALDSADARRFAADLAAVTGRGRAART